MEDNREFFGKIRWHMNVSSDCEDTAFFIRVYFVEDDIAYNLAECLNKIQENIKAKKSWAAV